jgi:hypothetical protein
MLPDHYLKSRCRHGAGAARYPGNTARRALPCPHCGKTTASTAATSSEAGFSTQRLLVAMVVIALIAGGAALWLSKPGGHAPETKVVTSPTNPSNPPVAEVNTVTNAPEPQPQLATNDFAVMPFTLERTPGSSLVYVTGVIRNVSSRQRFGVKVTFGLFDTNEEPVGTATDYHEVIEPHADWSFRAMVIPSRAATVQFNSIEEEK